MLLLRKKKSGRGAGNLDEIPAETVDWCERKQLLYSLVHIGCFVIGCRIVPCGTLFQLYDMALNTLREHVLSCYAAVCVHFFSLGVRMIIDCRDIIISFNYCFSVCENVLTFPCCGGVVSLSSSLLLVLDGQCCAQ